MINIRRMTLRLISVLIFALGCICNVSNAAETPDYMKLLVGNNPPTNKSELAEQNVLALDTEMFGIYDKAQQGYRKNFLATHPVILALFTSAGGQLTLYRPGKEPLQAPSVPILYQFLKSVSHSSLAIFELAASHLENVSDQSWRNSMTNYRTSNQAALDSLSQLPMSDEIRNNLSNTLKGNIQFMNDCLSKGTYTFADIDKYVQTVKPYLLKNIWNGGNIQVSHWMSVLKDWKQMLGDDWNKTYGVSNALYVTRQNNVIFSVLAQFFGKEAMNTRLFLFETPEFTTTPEQMFDVLIRTVADRSVGQVFFGNYYLMDYELMGGAARKTIQIEAKKLGIPVYLPPAVPFHSTEWPMRIDPAQGEGPTSIEEITVGAS